MIGVRLEMYGLLFTGPKTIIHNIRKCVENAGLIVNEMVITPLALTESILSDGEKILVRSSLIWVAANNNGCYA